MKSLAELHATLADADCLYTEQQIDSVLDDLAGRIAADYKDKIPLLLCVMNGGMFVMAGILRRLQIPLECDYMHVTRYRGKTSGGELHWVAKPKTEIKNRHVLIMDDIYDEGFTLQEILKYCREENAASVEGCVLVRKQHSRAKAEMDIKYLGVDVPDRYVFGCGMDYEHYFRNLNGVYALKENK